MAAGLLVSAAIAAPVAEGAPATQNIGAPTAPLTTVSIGADLSCQVAHVGDSSFEFFPPNANPGDCGTFVASEGALYAPDFASHDGTATGDLGEYTPFTGVSQSTVSGDGSNDSPYRVVTVATAGDLEITETDTYVKSHESYRTDVVVRNTGGAARAGILYRGGDCYLQESDVGYGFQEAGTASVGCSATPGNTPPGRIEEWIPITPGNNYTQDVFSTVWSQIGSKTPFPNTCAQCTQTVDNGAGISWNFRLEPGARATYSHYTTFSPTGRAGPPPPQVTGPEGNPLGLPPNRRCVDTRKFSFRLHHPKLSRIVDVEVYINGRRRQHLRGTNIERVTLKRLPKKRFRVRIVATQNTSAQLISVRTYKGCKKSRPRTRRGQR